MPTVAGYEERSLGPSLTLGTTGNSADDLFRVIDAGRRPRAVPGQELAIHDLESIARDA